MHYEFEKYNFYSRASERMIATANTAAASYMEAQCSFRQEQRLSLPLEDYALVGDCHTAALISKMGSVDWLCFPHFDSGACFAALLGKPEHGRWAISPAIPVKKVQRRYRPESLVLETEFHTAHGTVVLVDCMTPRDGTPNLLRMVVGKSGQVPMKMELVIRFDYGSVVP